MITVGICVISDDDDDEGVADVDGALV